MNLTAAAIRSLALPAGKSEVIIFDDTVAGFGIRIREGGSRTWVFQYAVGKKQRRLSLGRFPAVDVTKARKTAGDLYAKVRLGDDPAAEKADKQARAAETFGAEVRKYLIARNGTCRPSTYAEIERHLTKNLLPLHGLHIDKIDLRAVATELKRLTEECGAVQANRTRASLSKFFNWAAGEGLVATNPAAFTNKNPEQSRDRVLTTGELVEIWAACRDDNYGKIVRLLILTGQRRDEVAGMVWSELNGSNGTWTIPKKRTKNRREHKIALPAVAWAIIETVQKRAGRDLLFGNGEGQFSGFSQAKRAIDQRILEARREAAKKAGRPVEDVKPMVPWTVHDLRRSVDTHMGEDLGVQPHVVEALLNHVSGTKKGVAGIYNHAKYEREVRAALTMWAEHLTAIVEGRESNVTPFRQTA